MNDSINWVIGKVHPHYGMVVAMGCFHGEPYRSFMDSKNSITRVPLSVLTGENVCESAYAAIMEIFDGDS